MSIILGFYLKFFREKRKVRMPSKYGVEMGYETVYQNGEPAFRRPKAVTQQATSERPQYQSVDVYANGRGYTVHRSEGHGPSEKILLTAEQLKVARERGITTTELYSYRRQSQ